MKAKICFMNEIHRISKVPETLEGFKELVAQKFESKLPDLWSLQYVDSDGDNIILADNKDFEEFQKFGSSGATGASVIKVFIKPVNGMDVSQIKPEFSQDEDYQIIGEPEKKIEEIVEKSVEVEAPKVEEKVEEPKTEEESEDLKLEEESHSEPAPEKPEEKEVLEEEEERKEVEPEPAVEEKVEETKKEEEEVEGKNEDVQREDFSVSEILNNSARSVEFIGDKKVVVELDILEQLMGNALEKSLPRVIKQTTEELSKKEEKNAWGMESRSSFTNKVVHYGVRCNGCNALPIVGYRYKCTVCPDFDFCEECESTREHQHDFIKMKKHAFNNDKKVSFPRPGGILKRPEIAKKKPQKEEDEIQLIKGPENDYFKSLKDKAEKLQKCFPKEEYEILLAYINGCPDDMTVEELVENFKH